MTSRRLPLILGLALLVGAPGALAGPTKGASSAAPGAADASRYFQAGQKAFDAGRFNEAAQAFEQAFQIMPNPAPLINAGDAWEKAGEYAKAARDFQKVVHLKGATDQDRTDAIDRLARLKPDLGTIELLGKSSQRARIDDEEFHGGEDVFVYPGDHKVTLVDVQGAGVRDVRVDAGTARSVDLQSLLPAKQAGSTQEKGAGVQGAEVSKHTGISPLTWTAYGVGAIGAAGAVVFGLQANSAANSYDSKHDRGDYDTFNRNKLLTNISLGVGVVGVGVGTVLLLRDLRHQHAAEHDEAHASGLRVTRVDVAPVASGGMVVTEGRF
jgi:tetratricopeptide (TPR) repeat protein